MVKIQKNNKTGITHRANQKVNKKSIAKIAKNKGTKARDSQLRAKLDAGLMDMIESTAKAKEEKEKAIQHRKQVKAAEASQSKTSHEELLRQLENMKNFGL